MKRSNRQGSPIRETANRQQGDSSWNMPVAAAVLALSALIASACPSRALAADQGAPTASSIAEKARIHVETGFSSPFLNRRIAAARALVAMGPDAGDVLAEFLDDPRYQVRLWTIMTLGDLGHSKSARKMIEHAGKLEFFDLEISMALVRSLSKLLKASPGISDRDFEGMKEPAKSIVIRALGLSVVAEVTGRLGANIGADGDSGSYVGQFRSLLPLGRQAVYALMEILGSGKGPVPKDFFPEDLKSRASETTWVSTLRWLCILALGDLGDRTALPGLERCFEEFFDNAGSANSISMARACAYSCMQLGNGRPLDRLLSWYRRPLEYGMRNPDMLISRYFDIGYTYNMIGKTDEALEYYRKCVLLSSSQGASGINSGQTAQYNIACLHAVRRDVEAGLRALKTAMLMGYSNGEWMAKDGDLDNLRHDPRFELLKARMQVAAASGLIPGKPFQNRIDRAMESVAEAVDGGLKPVHWIAWDRAFNPARSSDSFAFENGRMLARPVLFGGPAAFRGF